FDGDPAQVTEGVMDETGATVGTPAVVEEEPVTPEEQGEAATPLTLSPDDGEGERRKLYVDGGTVEIAAHLVYELDAHGKLQVKKFTEYTGEKLRSMYSSAAELRAKWSDAEERAAIIAALEERGITFEELAEAAKQPEADPFDLLCHVAYSAPVRSRRERAEAARQDGKAFFEKYTDGAREVLNELLDNYVEFGTAQFQIPDILKVPPISQHGNVMEVAGLFGGADKLREAVGELQQLLYAA
ncbi:MAG: type I restriction-modification enzyme R subunit C-terminal domain-containing protein, partial [Bryobacteraceae bacterium]